MITGKQGFDEKWAAEYMQKFDKEIKPFHPDTMEADDIKVYNITPIPKPRMTRSDKWKKRPAVVRYFEYKDKIRAAGKPYYKYIVHNKVKYEGYAGGTDIMINHYGYKSGEVLQRKYERTKAILQKRLDLDPADFIAMYYIAQIAVGESDWNRVIEYGTKALEYCTITDPQEFQYFGVIYYWIAYAYLKQGDGVNAFPWISKGIEFYPDDIDLNYIMAEYGYLTDQKDLCLEHAARYEKALEKFKQGLTNNPVSFKTVIEHDDMQKRITYCSSDENLKMISEWRKVYE